MNNPASKSTKTRRRTSGAMGAHAATVLVVLFAVLSSGCVSRSLDSSDFADNSATSRVPQQTGSGPQELGYANDGNAAGPQSPGNSATDPAARANAIAEIRAKANTSGNNPPSAYKQDDESLEPKSPEEVRQLQQDLQAASDNGNQITDAELAAKQESMRRLRQRAGSHYNDALQKIEN